MCRRSPSVNRSVPQVNSLGNFNNTTELASASNMSRLQKLVDLSLWKQAEELVLSSGCDVLGEELPDSQRDIGQNGHSGELPIHRAIRKGAPDSFVLCLINKYERGIMMSSNEHWLPLHYAVYYGCSSLIIEILITKYPQALDECIQVDRHMFCSPRDFVQQGKSTVDNKSKKMISKPTSYWEALRAYDEKISFMKEMKNTFGVDNSILERIQNSKMYRM